MRRVKRGRGDLVMLTLPSDGSKLRTFGWGAAGRGVE
jgi:hypothetical protein